MPIANRSIEPVFVSQINVPTTVDNELEYVVNATLSNLIKQIACLSVKANDIFGELTFSLISFVNRADALDYKIQSINVKVDENNCDIIKPLVNHQLSIYRSQINRDDELLDHTQMPDCIKEMFDEAQAPPELFKFDEFRKSDEKSMTFYTDPNFFLNEWLKNARNKRKKNRENKKKRKSTAVSLQTSQPPLPPPLFIDPIIEEPTLDDSTMDYNFQDVAVYEDPTILNVFPKKIHGANEGKRSSRMPVDVDPMHSQPIPPPPPVLPSFPTCLPPSPPPPPVLYKAPPPSVKNLLADIQKGSVLRPVAERLEVKEKTRDFRELIQELRPAWDNQSDDSDDSDD